MGWLRNAKIKRQNQIRFSATRRENEGTIILKQSSQVRKFGKEEEEELNSTPPITSEEEEER